MNNNQNDNSNNTKNSNNNQIFEKEYKNGVNNKPTPLTTFMISSNRVGTTVKVNNAMSKTIEKKQ